MKYLSNYNESTNTFIGKDIDLQFIKDSLADTLDNNKYKSTFLFYAGRYIELDDFKGFYYSTSQRRVNDILNDSIDKYRPNENRFKDGTYLYGLVLEIDITLSSDVPKKLGDISCVKDNMIKVANILEDIETFLNRAESSKYKVSYSQTTGKLFNPNGKYDRTHFGIILYIFDRNAKYLIDAQESTYMKDYDSDMTWIDF